MARTPRTTPPGQNPAGASPEPVTPGIVTTTGPAAGVAGSPHSPSADPKAVTTAGQVASPNVGPQYGGTQPSQDMNAAWGPTPVFTDGMTFWEIGQTGLRQFSGWVREEFLQTLVGRQGAQKYREMMDNSPTIGGLLFAIQGTMRKVEWRVQPAESNSVMSKAARSNFGGSAQAEADFIDSCREDMTHSWEDHVTEALSMLPFGFSWHEIVYKKREGRERRPDPRRPGQDLPKSDYNDGKIGWRRLPGRSQDTLIKWFFDENGQTQGVTQQPWVGPLIDIPIEKSLLFRPTHYKANPEGRPCPLDTKVRTPRGWTTMGEITVGDEVYDDQGCRRRVVGKSEVFRDRPVFEIEFTTGATVRADACHVWRVSNVNDRTHGKMRDMTTEQLAAEFDRVGSKDKASSIDGIAREERVEFRRARSISCGVAPILQDHDAPLTLDPYVLGYWLGNGHSGKNVVSSHAEDAGEIASFIAAGGFEVEVKNDWSAKGQKRDIGFYADKKWSKEGPLNTLRMLGVLGRKHVPKQYMTASAAQRLAVLQGLMDSDGWSPGQGAKDEASTFANTNMAIIDAVMELVRSLGGQPRMRVLEEAGAAGGVINGNQVVAKQTSYEVRFMLDLPVHRLQRKLLAQVRRKTHRNSAHFIKAIRRVENADTVCIEVDSPSHLFLVGECMVPTHNSILRNSYVPYYYSKRLQEQEAILFERLGGVPVIKVPGQIMEAAAKGDPAATAALNAYKRIAVNLRTDEQMGLVLPSDMWPSPTGGATSAEMYKFELVAPQMRSANINMDSTIARYSVSMLTSVLADFLTLGHEARGTQSLAVTKVDLFMQAVEGYLNSMASIYNRYGIPRLEELNGVDEHLWPTIQPDMAQRVDLDVLSNFVLRLSQAGMPLFPDDDLQAYLKDAAGLPDVDDTRALQAAGLLPAQLDLKDEQSEVGLDRMKNPQDYATAPGGGPGKPGGPPKKDPTQRTQADQNRDNLEKMILKGIAQRQMRLAGPRFGVTTGRVHKHRHGGGLRRRKRPQAVNLNVQ